jgi:hypothetical protein
MNWKKSSHQSMLNHTIIFRASGVEAQYSIILDFPIVLRDNWIELYSLFKLGGFSLILDFQIAPRLTFKLEKFLHVRLWSHFQWDMIGNSKCEMRRHQDFRKGKCFESQIHQILILWLPSKRMHSVQCATISNENQEPPMKVSGSRQNKSHRSIEPIVEHESNRIHS